MNWATLELTESSPATNPMSWLTISPYCWITGARLSASIFNWLQKIRVAPARAPLYTVIRTSPIVIPLVVSDANTTIGRSKGSSVMVIEVIEFGSNADCDSQWKNFFSLTWKANAALLGVSRICQTMGVTVWNARSGWILICVADNAGRGMREYGDFLKLSGGGPSDHWGSFNPYAVVVVAWPYGGR